MDLVSRTASMFALIGLSMSCAAFAAAPLGDQQAGHRDAEVAAEAPTTSELDDMCREWMTARAQAGVDAYGSYKDAGGDMSTRIVVSSRPEVYSGVEGVLAAETQEQADAWYAQMYLDMAASSGDADAYLHEVLAELSMGEASLQDMDAGLASAMEAWMAENGGYGEAVRWVREQVS